MLAQQKLNEQLAAEVRAAHEAVKATTEQTKATKKETIALATKATMMQEGGGLDLITGQVTEDTVEGANPSTASTQLK